MIPGAGALSSDMTLCVHPVLLTMRPAFRPQITNRSQDPGSPNGARTLSQLERDHILSTLEQSYWRLEGEGGAAARLGINPSTLRSRMRKYGIRRPGSRPLAEPLTQRP